MPATTATKSAYAAAAFSLDSIIPEMPATRRLLCSSGTPNQVLNTNSGS